MVDTNAKSSDGLIKNTKSIDSIVTRELQRKLIYLIKINAAAVKTKRSKFTLRVLKVSGKWTVLILYTLCEGRLSK